MCFRKMCLSENVSVGKFVCRKIWPSENVVVGKCSCRKICRRKICVGKFAVGKIVSENLPSENLLSEKPPDTLPIIIYNRSIQMDVKIILFGYFFLETMYLEYRGHFIFILWHFMAFRGHFLSKYNLMRLYLVRYFPHSDKQFELLPILSSLHGWLK